MKRVVYNILLILLLCICLTGCSFRKVVELEGREQVEDFVNSAKLLQSGRYMLTNLDTGAADQVFSFINNADGTQSYLYERIVGERLFVEYSDGKYFYVIDEGKVKMYSEGEAGHISYTTEEPHPYSVAGLLFYVNLYASDSKAESDDKGNVTYTYTYDTEKINKALGTSLSTFVTTYSFDKEGNFLYFTQSNSDGENSYSYMIELLDADSLTELENPAG